MRSALERVAPGSLVAVDHDPEFEPELPEQEERRGLVRTVDLDQLIPPAERRIGAWRPNVGTLPESGGPDWDDLDLTRRGDGRKSDPEALQHYWDDAVERVKSWSPEQRAALDKYFVDHPEVGPGTPEFWDEALKQSDRARYWYEVSTRKMQHEGLDRYPEDAQTAFNVLAGTSGNSEPEPNMRRTLGVLAERQRQIPVATDLMLPGAVRAAFQSGSGGAKYGNFARTFGHIAGLDPTAPVSVNDRQVAAIHGIDRNELAKNPALYGVLSHFYQNLRDGENAARAGEIVSGAANPYESWQLQALGWTQQRADKRAAKAGEEGVDDYAQVVDRLKNQLEGAGIDTRPGLFSREVLGHPMVPDLMSSTRRMFLDVPVATVETGTTMTPQGQRASELLAQLPRDGQPWADTARAAYEAIQRRAMRRLGSAPEKSNSVLERLAAPLVGVPVEMRRIDSQGGFGHFEGDVSPNMRIPMMAKITGRGRGSGAEGLSAGDRIAFSPEHINALLGALGHDLGQRAMAASRFRELTDAEAAAGIPADTWSVFLPEEGERGRTPIEQLDAFGRRLGLGLNIARGPTGTLADINHHPDWGRPTPLTQAEVIEAANEAFGAAPARIIARRYNSHYLVHPNTPDAVADPTQSYDWHLNNFWSGVHAGDQRPSRDEAGRVRAPDWDAGRRLGDFEGAREEVRGIAAKQRAETQAWIDKYERRITRAAPRGQPLTGPPPEGPGGALAANAQLPQPPPVPVDYQPIFGLEGHA